MKNSQYRLTQKRRKLNELRRRGVPAVNWKLDLAEYEYLSKFFSIEPERYSVQTREYLGTNGFPRILKTLDRAAKQGKGKISKKLTEKEKSILDGADIPYQAFRYNIIL